MIDLARVTCIRGGRTLFADLSLTLDAGGAARVTGANGAGKSSLLRIAAGLLAPAAGSVTREARIALLAEQAALDHDVTLVRALGFWARVDGATQAAVVKALHALGLHELAEAPVRILSTGQRRRAGMARVIASGAGLWLLDEPTSGLDAESVALVEAAIAQHRAAGGATLVATHQPIELPDARMVAL